MKLPLFYPKNYNFSYLRENDCAIKNIILSIIGNNRFFDIGKIDTVLLNKKGGRRMDGK